MAKPCNIKGWVLILYHLDLKAVFILLPLVSCLVRTSLSFILLLLNAFGFKSFPSLQSDKTDTPSTHAQTQPELSSG